MLKLISKRVSGLPIGVNVKVKLTWIYSV